MRWLASVALVAGCNDAVMLEVAGDRPVPEGVSAICIGVADTAASGGQFGHVYRLSGDLGALPQTLRLEPGDAAEATVWVRGERGGVPVARAIARTDFGDDVRLALDRCVPGSGGAPRPVGAAAGPVSARLVGSQGPGGNLVVALGAAGEAAVLDASGGTLVARAAPPAPAMIRAVVAADVDGDCDDDLVIAGDGPPAIWRRDHGAFVADGMLGDARVAALAAADVDRDGDVDLITGTAGTLALWLNAGGRFTRDDNGRLAGAGRVTAISALAVGDIDGDGNGDLVVGQAGGPLAAWLNDPAGRGTFAPAEAVVPPVPLDVAALALVEADLDYQPDLAVVVRDAPMRLYINRGGHLEDQSFVRLPRPTPVAAAVAIAGWDTGCEPDAVIAATTASAALRGEPGGVLAAEAEVPAATDVVMIDLDDDGDLDAVLATAEGARWLAR